LAAVLPKLIITFETAGPQSYISETVQKDGFTVWVELLLPVLESGKAELEGGASSVLVLLAELTVPQEVSILPANTANASTTGDIQFLTDFFIIVSPALSIIIFFSILNTFAF
jgi:hypothetical protein